MLKLILGVLIEAIVGLALAGVLLGVSVPLLLRMRLITPGDWIGAFVVGAVLVAAVAGMLFRPGSALNRRRGG